VGFRLKLVRSKFRGLHSRDVPEVKIFVTAKTQEFAITISNIIVALARQITPAANQAGRPTMFQAAITYGQHKQRNR